MYLLIALYLMLVIALPLTLSAAVTYRTLPRTTFCPLCGVETLRLRSRWLRAISHLLRHQELQSRWCPTCRWEGTARLPSHRLARPLHTNQAQQRLPRRSHSTIGPVPSGEAISLRDLEIDGLNWRVLLQCWHDDDQWFGRLLFIAPTGRLWVDTVRPMNGASPREIMGQAAALPDRLLTGRLRELISD